MTSKRRGCDLTVDGQKCLSVSTGVQHSGAWELLVHAQGGPGVQRHLHIYADVTPEGIVLSGGARVKNNVGDYLSTGCTLSHTTQKLARAVVRRGPNGLTCQLRQCTGARNWLETGSASVGGPILRRQIELPGTMGSSVAEYGISLFDARSGTPSASSDRAVVPFSQAPFGLAFTRVKAAAADTLPDMGEDS